MIMKKNMGTLDRVVRTAMAIALITLYATHTITGTAGIVLLILAGVFIVTGFVSYCPLYRPFGINTTGKSQRKENRV